MACATPFARTHSAGVPVLTKESLIQTRRESACLTVTINRPAKANALTHEMLETLRKIFHQAAGDDALRAIIITGAGQRVFCAGADLTTLYDKNDGPDLWKELAEALQAIPVLSVAAINGPCIGGGLTLALGCDIRICVPEAQFSYPVLKNNVLPGQYDINKLKALTGVGRSAAILLGGETLSSKDAVAWGLVDRLVPRNALEETCLNLCATAQAADGTHLKSLKAMLKGNAS